MTQLVLLPPGVARGDANVAAKLVADRAPHATSNLLTLGGAAAAVVFDDWERHATPGFGAWHCADDLLVVADAALYYRDQLRAALPDHLRPASTARAAALVAAAYRAWGDDCVEYLEGDFAFALWDGTRRRLLAACDHAGFRPLYHAETSEGPIVASSLDALRRHPQVSGALDLAAIAEAAAGAWGEAASTPYAAIRRLPPGCRLRWHVGGGVKVTAHFDVPAPGSGPAMSRDDEAETLRTLLEAATFERLDASARATVWMSGGWDSTAVFGAGMSAVRASGNPGGLSPVSISYPPGDPGHEDAHIRAVAEHWQVPVRWLDIGDITLLEGAHERAAHRAEAFGHPYEQWNRALARATRATGSHVALTGYGGDQLFHVSDVVLSDLFYRGCWRHLHREWRAKGGGSSRAFWRWVLAPGLPRIAIAAARRLDARLPGDHLDVELPSWLRPEFVRRHALRERQRAAVPPRRPGRRADGEVLFYLRNPFFGRVGASVAGIARSEGVDLRSPLFDARVLRFAIGRAHDRRNAGDDRKLLLREAMTGLLPASVLAPRPRKTGLTSGFFAQRTRGDAARDVARAFEHPILEALGIADARRLREAWQGYQASGDAALGGPLVFAYLTECWLRHHACGGAATDLGMATVPSPAAVPATGAAHSTGETPGISERSGFQCTRSPRSSGSAPSVS